MEEREIILKFITGNHYQKIKILLRNDLPRGEFPRELTKIINVLDKMIARNKIAEDLIVFSGTDNKDFIAAETGDEIQEKISQAQQQILISPITSRC